MPLSKPIDFSQAVDYAALKDKNVLLTGAASGFGASAAKMFAQHGANLVLADLNEAGGKAVEQELASSGANVKFVRVDVTSVEAQVKLLQEALAFFPRNEVDIYVPNAGILGPPLAIAPADPAGLSSLTSVPQDLAAPVITVNLHAVYVGAMLTLRYGMGLHKSGTAPSPKSIVLLDSLAGYCGAEGCVSYTAAKFGVRGFMRGLRKHAAAVGVRVNSVCPFYVDTPMTAALVPALQAAGIPVASIDHVLEAMARAATDEAAWGRAISVMPEGLMDLGDDAVGKQAGTNFSTAGLGEHWAVLINGPLSDEIPA
ncbi:5'-hydroxyaverantin dehydrogenase [Cercospora beticola]|uniref:5'-hydroxyaverantin dehydrogenase n=1 Tax=Cercospora beticola TaxID=122368 RepID=A0A2G5HP29_CERBT|nr:5'-hydroxyaverantin dehydrogenase [Cercospora beticola]PIA94301.1 5'-hydroxyaverantin dehydrogenase [Cercospora beticola]WPB04751.1 hypothetical protein RHO25_009398 [Cercospora beticola]